MERCLKKASCEEKTCTKCSDIFEEFGDNHRSNLVVERPQEEVEDKPRWLSGTQGFHI